MEGSLALGNVGIQLVGMQPREKMVSLPLSALLYFLLTASLGSKHEPRSLGLSHIPLQFLRKPSQWHFRHLVLRCAPRVWPASQALSRQINLRCLVCVWTRQVACGSKRLEVTFSNSTPRVCLQEHRHTSGHWQYVFRHHIWGIFCSETCPVSCWNLFCIPWNKWHYSVFSFGGL